MVLQKLRFAFFVGDMLIKKDVLRLRTLAPHVHCINMYGSTETQRAVGYMDIEPDSADLQKVRGTGEVLARGSSPLCGGADYGQANAAE